MAGKKQSKATPPHHIVPVPYHQKMGRKEVFVL